MANSIEMKLRFLCVLAICGLGCGSDAGSGSPDPAESEDEPDASSPARDASQPRDASATLDARADEEPEEDAATPVVDASAPAKDASTDASGGPVDAGQLARFSFFMTSLKAMRELSGSQNGFGGDLRFGETGDNAGLRGADKICSTIAEQSMPGSSAKQWRAFLSVTKGEGGKAVNASDRIGDGPWYDRLERLVANAKSDLLQTRPANAQAMIKNDLPNEDGVPNHAPDGSEQVDNHHVLTGSSTSGKLFANDAHATCSDWTKAARDTADAPRVGLSWPRGGQGNVDSSHWISAMNESGCAPGVTLGGQGGPQESNPTVGSGGGYGAIYCFALTP